MPQWSKPLLLHPVVSQLVGAQTRRNSDFASANVPASVPRLDVAARPPSSPTPVSAAPWESALTMAALPKHQLATTILAEIERIEATATRLQHAWRNL